jgi:hypothetical protein
MVRFTGKAEITVNPEVKDLVLRVHTRVEGAKPFKPWRDTTKDRSPKWAKHALFIDCETTTEELGQRLNFSFYRKCQLINDEYKTMEEGIIIADDLEKRLGAKAVELLDRFAAKNKPDTICGRFAKMRVYTRSEFVKKIFFPWVVLKKAAIVGANLAFDLSVLSVAYHEHKTENGFSSELAARYQKREHKRYPRVRTVPKNSHTAFFDLSGGTGPYKCGRGKRGRFLDVLNFAFAMRNVHYSLKSACSKEGWNVPGKLDHKPCGNVTLDEIKYCREDVAATLRLLNAQRNEYETFPIDLTPEKALSPASIAKSFLESMGIKKPKDKFRKLPEWIHGVAMESYYGGRSEVRIRDIELPVMLVDYTSNYPTAAALLNVWQLMTAKNIRIKDVTAEANKTLNSVTLENLLKPTFWEKLDFIAQVLPDGQIFPVRTEYADMEGEATNIGCNPLFSKTPIWVTGPDLANAVLQKHRLKILSAIRLVPIGIQKGLQAVKIGDRMIDPGNDEPYIAWVELKEVASGSIKQFIKVLLNSGVYGLAVELNLKRYSKNKPKKVRIWAGGQELPSVMDIQAEIPGQWYFPWIATLITGGGRLLLGILEKEVSRAKGSFLMTDTDSMAIIANEREGLIPCPGGTHTMPDGSEAVKALSRLEVEQLTERIQKLSPYGSKIKLLKIDKANLDRNGKPHQLYGIGYSAKRYCLRTTKEIIKPSEHGLGPYFVPAYKDDKRFWKPDDCLKDDVYLRWVKELWEVVLGIGKDLPKWSSYYSMRKYAVTTPNVLKKLRRLDRDAAKPYSFCIGPISSFGSDTKVTPYCEDPERWKDREYISLKTGQKTQLSSIQKDCEGEESFLIDDAPHKLQKVIENYSKSIEHKSLAPDGSKCTCETRGLLRRRPIRASGRFQRIGKEVDRGTSTDPEYFSEEQLARYGKNRYHFPEVLKKYSNQELAARTGLSEKTIRQARKNGSRIHPRTAARLLWYARIVSQAKGRRFAA